MKQSKTISRRGALRLAGAAVVAVPVAALTRGRVAWAEEQPQLDESNPQAQGLGYKHDASTVDTAAYPAYQEGRKCGTCQLYQGADGSEWGPCAIFPGYNVNANGWCSAWVQKA